MLSAVDLAKRALVILLKSLPGPYLLIERSAATSRGSEKQRETTCPSITLSGSSSILSKLNPNQLLELVLLLEMVSAIDLAK